MCHILHVLNLHPTIPFSVHFVRHRHMKATISIDYSRVTIPSICHCSGENYFQNTAPILRPHIVLRVALLQKLFCSILLCVDALSIVESKETEMFDNIIDFVNSGYKRVQFIEIWHDANKLWYFHLTHQNITIVYWKKNVYTKTANKNNILAQT